MSIDRDELRQRIEEELYEVWTQRTKRRYDADLRVWERHRSAVTRFIGDASRDNCGYDKEIWPCPDFVDLAARYGLTP